MSGGFIRCSFQECFPGRKKDWWHGQAQRRHSQSGLLVLGRQAAMAAMWISVLSEGARGEGFP